MVYHRVAVVILYGVFQLLIPQHSSQAIPIFYRNGEVILRKPTILSFFY